MANRDAIVTFKVLLQATGAVKAMRFGLDMSIGEVIKEIREKQEIGGKDHGLFLPPDVETGTKAMWLAKNRTLRFYGLPPNTQLEFKKIHRPLRISLIDGTKKMVVINDSESVQKICGVIGEKIGLKSWEEFSLRKPGGVNPDGTEREPQWLNDAQTLQEQDVKETDELEYAKRYYYNDDFIDKDDPFSLHLLYVDANQAIVQGRYPITRTDARDFAALQVQVVYGDHDPAKHKPGWINPNDFFPPAYRKDKKLEKEVYVEHKKLVGTKTMNAKFRYVQLVRSLKSYGITYFEILLKVKGKKKPKPHLLGVTRSSIMKTDPATMVTEKEWKWEHMRRWSVVRKQFTLDFGDYADDYMIFTCEKAEALSSMISGYIELILRARVDPTRVIDDDDDEIAEAEDMEADFGLANQGMVASGMSPYGMGGGQGGMGDGFMRGFPMGWPMANAVQVEDLGSALRATSLLSNELGTIKGNWGMPSGMPEDEWAKQFDKHKTNIADGMKDLLGQARLGLNNINRNLLDKTAKELVMETMSMATAARNLAAYNSDQAPLLDGAKAVADSLAGLMGFLDKALNNPDDYAEGLEDALQSVEKLFAAAQTLMNVNLADYPLDKGAELLLAEIISQIDISIDDLLLKAQQGAGKLSPEKQKELLDAIHRLQNVRGLAVAQLKQLSPGILEPNIAKHLEIASVSLTTTSRNLTGRATALGVDNAPELNDAAWRLNRALNALMNLGDLAERTGVDDGAVDLMQPVQQLIKDLAQLRADIDDPKAVIVAVKLAAEDQNQIVTATQQISTNADDNTRERMEMAAASVTKSVKELMDATRSYSKAPEDKGNKDRVLDVVSDLEKQAYMLIGDAGTVNALNNLRYAAKVTAGSLMKLTNSSSIHKGDVADKEAQKKLMRDVAKANENVADLLNKIKAAAQEPRNYVRQNDLLEAALFQLPHYAELVSTVKKALASVQDPNVKQELDISSTETSNNLRLLAKAVATVSNLSGDATLQDAMSQFDVIRADLDTAEAWARVGKLFPVAGATKEGSLNMLNLGETDLINAIGQLNAEAEKGYASSLSAPIKDAAFAFQQIASAVRPLAPAISAERTIQGDFVVLAKDALEATIMSISSARALAIDKGDKGKKKALGKAFATFQASIDALNAASKGVSTRDISASLAAVDKVLARLDNYHGESLPRTQLEDHMVRATKALALAMEQLGVTARTNPDALEYSGKVVETTLGRVVDDAAALLAASTSEDEKKRIRQAVSDLVKAAKQGLTAADALASKPSDASAQGMSAAEKEVLDRLAALRAIFSQGSSVSQAITDLMWTLSKANDTKHVVPGTAADILSELLAESKELQRIGASLTAATKHGAEAVALFANEAAAYASALVDTAKAATISNGTGEFLSLNGARIKLGADLIVQDASNEQRVHRIAKQITQASANLIGEAKAKARSEPDANVRANIVKAAQSLIVAASKLAHAASNSNEQIDGKAVGAAASELQQAAVALEATIRNKKKDGDVVAPELAKKLVVATNDVGLSTSKLLQAAADVAEKKGSEKSVADARAALDVQIAALSALCGALNPAIQATENCLVLLKKSSIELEGAILSAQDGKLTGDTRGRALGQIQADAAESLVTVGGGIPRIANSLEDTAEKIAAASGALGSDGRKMVNELIALAAASTDDGARLQLLGLAKALVDTLHDMMKSLQAANMGDASAGDAVKNSSASASQAVNLLINQLQAETASLAEFDVQREKIEHSLAQLSSEVSGGAGYSKTKADLVEAVKDFSGKITHLLSVDKTNVRKALETVSEVATAAPALVQAASLCASSSSEAAGKRGIVEGAEALVASSAKMVAHAKGIAEGKNENTHLLKAYNDANKAIAQLMSTTQQVAVGDHMIEKALSDVAKSLAAVGTASMYAAAGQLEPSEETRTAPMSSVLDKLTAASKSAVTQAQAFNAAADKSDIAAGNAAAALADTLKSLADSVENAAGRLSSSEDQKNVLDGAKNVMAHATALLKAGRAVQRHPNDSVAKANLAAELKAIDDAVSGLHAKLENSAADLTAFEASLEEQKKLVLATLKNQPKKAGSSPEDVVKAAREVIKASADIYFSEDDLQVTASAERAANGSGALVAAVNGVKDLSTDSDIQEALGDGAAGVIRSLAAMIETSKLNREDDETMNHLERNSEQVTQSVNELIYALKRLPGTEGISLEEKTTDLDSVAERELLKCAEIIAEAAKTLLAYKPERKVKKVPGQIDQEDINEAILDAAGAIASATGALVQAAATAQQERVKLVKETPGGRKYQADPAWANGLISAAQNVSGAVTHLVKAANESVQGKAQEEALVASAKAVATATAHLVAASRAKADPGSKSQMNLKAAATAVSNATAQLVSAAHTAAQFQEEEEVEVVVNFGTAGGKVKELEQQMLILRLEKELEKARQTLSHMRKARYQK